MKHLGVVGQLIFVMFAALMVFGFVSAAKEGEMRRLCATPCLLKPDYLGADRKAPDFLLKDMSGQDVKLSNYLGKAVVLNFWTKTCGPCLEEMLDLVKLNELLKEKNAVLVTVSTDEGPNDVRDALKAASREPITFPVLFDPSGDVVRTKYGTKLFPETWIIDPRGVIRARFDGAKTWTHPVILEFIDEVGSGVYCPVDMKEGRISGKGAKLCLESNESTH